MVTAVGKKHTRFVFGNAQAHRHQDTVRRLDTPLERMVRTTYKQRRKERGPHESGDLSTCQLRITLQEVSIRSKKQNPITRLAAEFAPFSSTRSHSFRGILWRRVATLSASIAPLFNNAISSTAIMSSAWIESTDGSGKCAKPLSILDTTLVRSRYR
jgi:hypothetical protein